MSVLRWIFMPYRNAAAELMVAAEALLARSGPLWAPVASLLLTTLAAWFVYVPVHELLHAFGCLAAGGTVEELQIAPLYGGALLERVLPFVRARGEYAGRLARFDTGGSDLVYLATDFAPYVLTVAGAFPLLRWARRRRSSVLFGAGAVVAVAPLIGLAGDYYEMGSIIVSGLMDAASGHDPSVSAMALRSDDLIALLAAFPARFPEPRLAWGLALAGSAFVGWALCTLTLAAAAWPRRRLAPAPDCRRPGAPRAL